MAKPDGRVEAGQSLKRAISAQRWNDLCDAADIVHGRRGGVTAGNKKLRGRVLSKTPQEWGKGTSLTLSVFAGTPGSETETSDKLLAWNKFADIPVDSWVMLARCGGGWYVIAAECE